MARDDSDNDVMTIDDLSAYPKLSKSTVYRLAQAGEIPGQKVGRTWRFLRRSIDRWLDEAGPAESGARGDR